MNLGYDNKEVQKYALKWLLTFGTNVVPINALNDAWARGESHRPYQLHMVGYVKKRFNGFENTYQLTPEGLEHLKCL